MAVALRAAAVTTNVTSAATTWTVNTPTGLVAGDYALIYLANNVGSTASTPTITGWTSQQLTNESSGLKGTLMTKVWAGTEGSTVSVGWGASTNGLAIACGFSGVNSTPLDVAAAGVAEPSSSAVAAHATPSITTVTAGCGIVSAFCTDVVATWTIGTGDTEIGDLTGGGNVSGALYFRQQASAGAISSTGTASTTSVKAVSQIMALRPAPVAATTPRRRIGRRTF